jgi:hypothetical protein
MALISSAISSRGFITRALATARRCRCPPLKLCPRRFKNSSLLGKYTSERRQLGDKVSKLSGKCKNTFLHFLEFRISCAAITSRPEILQESWHMARSSATYMPRLQFENEGAKAPSFIP